MLGDVLSRRRFVRRRFVCASVKLLAHWALQTHLLVSSHTVVKLLHIQFKYYLPMLVLI